MPRHVQRKPTVSQFPPAHFNRHSRRPPRELLVDWLTELRERCVMLRGLVVLSVDRYHDGTLTEDGDMMLDHATFESLLLAIRDAVVRVNDLTRALHEAADQGRFHPKVEDEKDKNKEGK